jgi:hypothetical protein
MAIKVGLALSTTWSIRASPVDAAHPIENALLDQYPYRTGRMTLSDNNQFFLVSTAGAQNVDAILLNNVNFSQVTITPSGGTATQVVAAVDVDTRVNRRKRLIELGGTATNITGTCQNTVGGASYQEVGGITLVQTVTTLLDDPSFPLRYAARQSRSEIRFASGGREVQAEGERFLEIVLGSGVWTKDSGVLAQLQAIQNVGFSPLVLYENLGNTAHAYLVRRVDDLEIEQFVNTYGTQLRFEECI